MNKGICGDLSACKTLAAVFIVYTLWRRYNARIYSNCWLAFPHERIKSYSQFRAMRNGVFLADEISMYLDSYDSSSKTAAVINRICREAGKNGISIIWTAQHSSMIHKRLYNITSSFYLPEKHLARDAEGRQLLMNGRTFPDYCNLYELSRFGKPISFRRFTCPPIFPLYRTREKIEPMEGLEKYRAKSVLREHKAYEKAKNLGLDLSGNA